MESIAMLGYRCLVAHLEFSTFVPCVYLIYEVSSLDPLIERHVSQVMLEFLYLIELLLLRIQMISIDELIEGYSVAYWSLELISF
jgi:hypothetical protein